jgi:hypothetical protein
MNIWKYIKADPFFAEYLPEIKSQKFKIRGFNSRGNPTSFSDSEKAAIKKAIDRLFKDMKK